MFPSPQKIQLVRAKLKPLNPTLDLTTEHNTTNYPFNLFQHRTQNYRNQDATQNATTMETKSFAYIVQQKLPKHH